MLWSSEAKLCRAIRPNHTIKPTVGYIVLYLLRYRLASSPCQTHFHKLFPKLAGTQTHTHAAKLLRIFFAKLLCHCLQFHRFISGRRFCIANLPVFTVQFAQTHEQATYASCGTLSIVANATCTNIFSHPLKWRRRRCHNNGNVKEQDVCASNRRHCFRNIVDFNWLWRWFCRCGKVHSTCSASFPSIPFAAIIIGQVEYLMANTNVNNIIKTHTRLTCELWLVCLCLCLSMSNVLHSAQSTRRKTNRKLKTIPNQWSQKTMSSIRNRVPRPPPPPPPHTMESNANAWIDTIDCCDCMRVARPFSMTKQFWNLRTAFEYTFHHYKLHVAMKWGSWNKKKAFRKFVLHKAQIHSTGWLTGVLPVIVCNRKWKSRLTFFFAVLFRSLSTANKH